MIDSAPPHPQLHRVSHPTGGLTSRRAGVWNRSSAPRPAPARSVRKRPDQRDGPRWEIQPGPGVMRTYREAMTLFSVFLIAVLRRPSVTTTAIVMTPRTTAYSAMV